MGEQRDFALYKYFHYYLMDRLCESLQTWVHKVNFFALEIVLQNTEILLSMNNIEICCMTA